MKRIYLPLVAIALLATACTSTQPTAAPVELPATRPADFEISFHEMGGSDEGTSDYVVSADQAVYRVKEGGKVDEWTFKPDPQALDELYATVREKQVLTLKAEEEADKNANRFGYKLDLKWDGQAFSVSDQGNTYIQLEADYNRFMDIIAEVRAFVGTGISSQMIPLEVKVVLDAKSPLPDSLFVDIDGGNLIKLGANDKPGDTLQGEMKPLAKAYPVTAQAWVGGKEWTWKQDINLKGMQESRTLLKLGKAGFEEVK